MCPHVDKSNPAVPSSSAAQRVSFISSRALQVCESPPPPHPHLWLSPHQQGLYCGRGKMIALRDGFSYAATGTKPSRFTVLLRPDPVSLSRTHLWRTARRAPPIASRPTRRQNPVDPRSVFNRLRRYSRVSACARVHVGVHQAPHLVSAARARCSAGCCAGVSPASSPLGCRLRSLTPLTPATGRAICCCAATKTQQIRAKC